ncbi:MAG: hypothetical protein BMS9Abin26_0725 [Gammaproteobacteria bacterium]|nr:MAG: hypothetical protein BMS9Abin26_0725 [Gammaproteobacteria bacterium]
MLTGIRIRLIIPILAAFSIFAAVFNAYWLPDYIEKERENFLANEFSNIHKLAPAAIKEISRSDFAALTEWVDDILEYEKYWNSIEITSNDGNVLAYSFKNAAAAADPDPDNIVSITLDLEYQGNSTGTLRLVADSTGYISASRNDIYFVEIMLALLFGSILFILILLLEKEVIRPLSMLANATNSISDGDFSVPLPKISRSEIGRLTASFLNMSHNMRVARIELEQEAQVAKDAAKMVSRKNRIMKIVNNVQRQFITGDNAKHVFSAMLADLLDLTESRFILVAEVLVASTGVAYARTYASAQVIGRGKNKETRINTDCDDIVFDDPTSLIGRIVSSGSAVISNDKDIDDDEISCIPVENGIRTFMGLPIYGSSDLVGVLAVANRAGGYTSTESRELDMIVQEYGSLICWNRDRIALQKNEQQLAAVLDNVVDGIITTDEYGNIGTLNKAAEGIFGYSDVEANGMTFDMFLSDGGNRNDNKNVYAIGDNDDVPGMGGDTFARRKDGTEFPIDYAISEVTVSGKRLRIVLVRDITRRKGMEESLKRSEKRYRELVSNLPGAVYIRKPDDDMSMVFLSDAFIAISGYETKDIIGNTKSSYSGIIFREDIEDLRETVKRSLESGRPFVAEYRILNPDGEVVWVYDKGHGVVDEETGENLIDGVIFDITEQKYSDMERAKLQSQVQLAQKMEAVGQLTGGIAHDFNNILASMMGYCELAVEVIDKDSNGKVIQYLDQVYTSGERARDLIQKMLAFSRGEGTGEGVEPLVIEPLVNDVIKMLRSTIPSSIKIDINVEKDLPAVVIDPINFQQLIMNLCLNSKDAMKDQGRISISASRKHIVSAECSSCHQNFSGDLVDILLEDNGHGISESIMPRLFEPFFSTKEVGKGTGMGLSVIHGIMHDHNGHILVESEIGKGTAFHLYLQADTAHITKLQPEKGRSLLAAHGHGTIMVVDDEPTVGGFTSEVLSRSGYDVKLFNDSIDALAYFHSMPNKVDFIFTDHSMPGITGIQFAEEVLKIRPDVPVVICTGYSELLGDDKIKELGIRAILNKPMRSNELLQQVNDALQGRKRRVGS